MQLKQITLILFLTINALNPLQAADKDQPHVFAGFGRSRRCIQHTESIWTLAATGAGLIIGGGYALTEASEMLNDPKRIPGISITNAQRATYETTGYASIIWGIRLLYQASYYREYVNTRHSQHNCLAHDPHHR